MLLLLTALLAVDLVRPNKLSWCEYWFKRGVSRSECEPPRAVHWSLSQLSPATSNTVLAMPVCSMVSDWTRCQSSAHCPLGQLCWIRGSPCCTPQISQVVDAGLDDQCPTTRQLGVQCHMKNPVNWCNRDSDCHRTSPYQKCCPSGCGYNMCIRTSKHINVQYRLSAMSMVPEECPAMDTLSVNCIATGVSWCSEHSNCLSNAAHRRFCCPTRCGYNVCLLKLSDTKWIIA